MKWSFAIATLISIGCVTKQVDVTPRDRDGGPDAQADAGTQCLELSSLKGDPVELDLNGNLVVTRRSTDQHSQGTNYYAEESPAWMRDQKWRFTVTPDFTELGELGESEKYILVGFGPDERYYGGQGWFITYKDNGQLCLTLPGSGTPNSFFCRDYRIAVHEGVSIDVVVDPDNCKITFGDTTYSYWDDVQGVSGDCNFGEGRLQISGRWFGGTDVRNHFTGTYSAPCAVQ